MKVFWILTLAAMIAAVCCALTGVSPLITAGIGLVAIAGLIWLWISAILPVRKASIGLELLRSDEYNNRLSPSLHPATQRIVTVYNGLIDRLNEERLRLVETNNLLELLVKASPMGVAIMDFDNRFTLVNASFMAMTGNADRNLIGVKLADCTDPLLAAARHLKDREETNVTGPDTEIYRISRLSFLEKGFRRPFLLIERLTEEIRRAEKEAYGKVVRTISHEVNNTIGGLQSFLESLSEMENLDPDLRELSLSCMEGCGHLVNFIRGYADVVKIGEPMTQPTDYNEAIRKELPFLRSMLPENVSIETDLCQSSPLIPLDRAMMRQTLVNIVKNAGESIAETGRVDGRIKITTRVSGNRWTLEIEDNGKGIPEEESALIFNPFHTTKRNGQGLGLTLSAEVLRRHGFKFSLSTPEEGRTIFRITSTGLR